jgi:hypothetical protein
MLNIMSYFAEAGDADHKPATKRGKHNPRLIRFMRWLLFLLLRVSELGRARQKTIIPRARQAA